MSKKPHKNKLNRARAGQLFGKLTLLRKVKAPKNVYGQNWKVQCSCGTIQIIREQYLFRKNNPKTDCGCSKRSVITDHKRVYSIWKMMNRRCYYPTHVSYRYYGGIGITVHPDWLDGGYKASLEKNLKAFKAFLDHVGEPPSDKHTLDRKNPFKGYAPGNVRWATKEQQARNKRIHYVKRATKLS